MAASYHETQGLHLAVGQVAFFDVAGLSTGGIQLEAPASGLQGAAAELVRSNDGINWSVLEYPATLSGSSLLSARLDVFSHRYIGLRVTVGHPSIDTAQVHFYGVEGS